ncbi:hypothetical protein B0H67DRAFT_572356 [Lasiosphaeris hirsuta]|uniref:AAA+ ATPase domain-containing protein n=1 Tax=Lasiosphaeris hirsuta TaxID=260670 RepID=A0AA40B1Z0_9PEZI|nr:hypothetical protein B0H67DRAFT_572356 [Lasiosphaeris hirsuta]
MKDDGLQGNKVESQRTMTAKQIEMLSTAARAKEPDLRVELPFVLSDGQGLELHRYQRLGDDSPKPGDGHDDGNIDDDDDDDEDDDDHDHDYAQLSERRRRMERALVRELETLRREKEMIQSIRSLRRERDTLLEKERAWKQERLTLRNEIRKLRPDIGFPGDDKGPADAAQIPSLPEPAQAVALPANTQTEVHRSTQPVVAQPNYVEWSTFKWQRHSPENESFAIDVLEGESDLTSHHAFQPTNPKHNPGQGITTAKAVANPNQTLVPERIRINSQHIIKILEDISGEKLSAGGGSIVMIRPFKFLVYHKEDIQQKFSQLEVRFGSSSATAESAVTRQTEANPQTQNGHVRGEEERLTESFIAYEQLRCLIQFMDAEVRLKTRTPSSGWGEGQVVTFTDIWYLFKPGDEVISQDCRQVYRVVGMMSVGHCVTSPWHSLSNQAEANDDETPVTLHCVSIDFDGKLLGPVSRVFKIPHFDGECAITSLGVYPLRYAAARIDREMLIARGRMFLEAVSIRHMYYNGPTIEPRDRVDSHVVIDFEEAFAARDHGWRDSEWQPKVERLIGQSRLPKIVKQQECKGVCCHGEIICRDDDVEAKRNQDYISSLIQKDPSQRPTVVIHPRTLHDTQWLGNALTDDELVVTSYRVFGFVFKSRKWAQLDLAYLSPVNGPRVSQTAFDRLVLPSGYKDMILSLIAQHYRGKESSSTAGDAEQVDIVRGKGKGLIMLLHGPPGVGKTTTVECAAEVFNKPLLQINCGDVGTQPAQVESALETHFALASRWDCVLLLDEADVFLSARSTHDLIRNGLVAVFLRILESYTGLLFLTTNRIGDFDQAFASRIHISLHYPQLDLRSTLEIFKLNIRLIQKRFEDKAGRLSIGVDDIMRFAEAYWTNNEEVRWNGRQIRNGCQTALALAEFESQGGNHECVADVHAEIRLQAKHFETVSRANLNFASYLSGIHGNDDAERHAKAFSLRARETNGRKGKWGDGGSGRIELKSLLPHI